MEASRRPFSRRQWKAVTPEASPASDDVTERIPSPPAVGDEVAELGLVWERSDNSPSENELETEFGVISDSEYASQAAVQANNTQSGASLDIHPTAPPVQEIDTIIDDYNIQREKVIEQHGLIQSKKEFLKERKESNRTKIIALFSDILDILADKEASLLCKLDEMCKAKEDKLDELLASVEDANESIKTEANIAESVKIGDSHFKDVTLADIKPLLCDIKTGVVEREEELKEVLRDSDTQAVEINEEVINVINALDYVQIPEINNRNDNNDTEGAVANEQGTSNNYEAEFDHVSASETTEERHELEVDSDSEDRLESGITENGASGIDPVVSHGHVDIALPLPSAPPQPQAEEEPPPPPYWQAIGLSGPEEDTHFPRSPIPGALSSDLVPPFLEPVPSGHHSNELVFFHNFLLKRQYDARSSKPVALTWNLDRICVADRANSKVKVFTSSGSVYTEIYLGGCEIYDMAFIEAYSNEFRYVVTIPRAKTLMFISICNEQPPQLLHKLKLMRGYTSIAKGPSGNTFVGADALPSSGEPRIDILNIQGQVLRTFNKSAYTKFAYPRCVAVFHQAIVVADWKLNIVVVLHEDGRTIAQYGGTANFPLKEPISLTLDQFGNVMVVDGKTGNIHVIDLQGRPLEIVKCPRGQSVPKLIEFNTNSHRLAVVRHSGDIALYDFKGGYKTNSRNNETFSLNVMEHMFQPHYPEALPLVEGMLPSTIANIGTTRQRQANIVNRSNMFHL